MADEQSPRSREKNAFQPSRSDGRKRKKRKGGPSGPKKEEKTVKLPGDMEDDVMGAILGGILGFVIGLFGYWSPRGIRLFGFQINAGDAIIIFPGDIILFSVVLGILIGFMYRRIISTHHDWFGPRDW